MVHVLWMWKAKMKFYLYAIITAIILMPGVSLFASDLNDNHNQSRNISFGFTGTAGLTGLLSNSSDIENDKPGFTAGGGLVFEKMFTNRLGLHSGITYRYIKDYIAVENVPDPDELAWSFHTLTIPFLMILSANAKNSSFNLLAGISYINILDSTIKKRSSFVSDMESQKALSFINPHQVAATVGFNLKFKVTRFSDFFAGIIIDFHPTNLFRTDHGHDEYLFMYGGRIMTGFMFKTDLFPTPKKIL